MGGQAVRWIMNIATAGTAGLVRHEKIEGKKKRSKEKDLKNANLSRISDAARFNLGTDVRARNVRNVVEQRQNQRATLGLTPGSP